MQTPTPQFRQILRLLSAILFITALYNRKNLIRSSFSSSIEPLPRRIAEDIHAPSNTSVPLPEIESCTELFHHNGFRAKCDFLVANPDCDSGGFFYYLRFFYCDCGQYAFFGYFILFSALAVLFYLLGNTAADYFCCSLERLSNLLKLSPTFAGVTLLPFGNGAADVFSSIAAFMGSGSSDVGLSSVLGGAVFVTSVVVGVVSICVAKKRVQIDKKCFVRDVCFFLFTILCLGFILLVGQVTVAMAFGFVFIYVVYAVFVAFNEIMMRKGVVLGGSMNPLLPVANGFLHQRSEEDESLCASLIEPDSHGDDNERPSLASKLPHWVWISNVIMYSDQLKPNAEDSSSWGWSDGNTVSNGDDSTSFSCSKLWSFIEIPLVIPRRLTIPIVEEERWSKPYAVASAFFAPIFLSCIWSSQEDAASLSVKIVYVLGLALGCVLGSVAFVYTQPDNPPRKCLLPWVLSGFFMSIVWFYVIANELVALLVALGTILGINPSLLAITILAWGNSMGDLISNTALAMNNKPEGVQIAMSGSYAGPMFNTLIGIGVSMILAAWKKGNSGGRYVIPRDMSLLYTLGFLMASLIWALVVLPWSHMRPNRVLGIGLITIYLMFLCLRLGTAIGSPSQTGL